MYRKYCCNFIELKKNIRLVTQPLSAQKSGVNDAHVKAFKMRKNVNLLYRSCIALVYRKRLPQQNGDRWIGERETSMHLIVCGSEVGTRTLPSPPTRDKRRAWCTMTAPPPNSTQTGQIQWFLRKAAKKYDSLFLETQKWHGWIRTAFVILYKLEWKW